MPDWNVIGRLVNQIGTAAGSMVAGVYGGPAAAAGVQMAGGVVDKVIADYVPGDTPPAPAASPAPAANSAPIAAAPPAPLPPPQLDAGRAYDHLVSVGWAPDYAHQVASTGETRALTRYDGRANAEDIAGWVLLQAGWPRDRIEAILSGPLAFYQGLRPDFTPSPAITAGYAAHDHDGILASLLHRDTEPAGYAPSLYTGQEDVHAAGLGDITEQVTDEEET